MSLEAKLGAVVDRYHELRDRLAGGDAIAPAEMARMSKELSEVTPIAEKFETLGRARSEIDELDALIADAATDPDLRTLAGDEAEMLRERLPALERELRLMLLPKDEADAGNAILEVRADRTGAVEGKLGSGG